MAGVDEVKGVVVLREREAIGTGEIATEEIVVTGTEQREAIEVNDTANVPGRQVAIAHPEVPGATLNMTARGGQQTGIGNVSLIGSPATWT